MDCRIIKQVKVIFLVGKKGREKPNGAFIKRFTAKWAGLPGALNEDCHDSGLMVVLSGKSAKGRDYKLNIATDSGNWLMIVVMIMVVFINLY